MEVKHPVFEQVEVEIRETYVDEEGMVKVRTRRVLLPAGRRLPDNEDTQKAKGC